MNLLKIDRTEGVAGKNASDAAADITTETFLSKFYTGRNTATSILAIRWATLLFCLGVWGLVIAGIAAWLS